MSNQLSADRWAGWPGLRAGWMSWDLAAPVLDHHVGQGRALLVEKAAPVLARADHFRGGHAGQVFAGPVPDHHTAAGVEHEYRNRQHFHELVREGTVAARVGGIHEPLYCCACHVPSFDLSVEQLVDC
jgi:hypothetical protein